jgi:[acyl-carrier-protein] S-malonyltransferase
VDRLVEAVEAAGGAGRKLVVSAPFHCALMKPAAEALSAALGSVRIGMPVWPVLHNADGQVAGSPEEIRAKLVAQVVEPVRWEACVRGVKERGARRCIEVGPGKPLGGLIKRMDRGLPTLSLDTPGSWGAV